MIYEYEIDAIMFLKGRTEKHSFNSSVSAKNYCEGRYKAVEEIKENLKNMNKEYEECIILDKAYFNVRRTI